MKMRGGAGGPAGKPAFRRGLELKTSPPGGRLAARSGCQEWRPHVGASTVYAYFRKNTGTNACATGRSADAVARDLVFVQFDSQAGLFGDCQIAVYCAQLLARDAFPQCGFLLHYELGD